MAYAPDIEAKVFEERNSARLASFGKTAPESGPLIEEVERVIKILKPMKPCCHYGSQEIQYQKSGNKADAYMQFQNKRLLINFCPWCGADMRELSLPNPTDSAE